MLILYEFQSKELWDRCKKEFRCLLCQNQWIHVNLGLSVTIWQFIKYILFNVKLLVIFNWFLMSLKSISVVNLPVCELK